MSEVCQIQNDAAEKLSEDMLEDMPGKWPGDMSGHSENRQDKCHKIAKKTYMPDGARYAKRYVAIDAAYSNATTFL